MKLWQFQKLQIQFFKFSKPLRDCSPYGRIFFFLTGWCDYELISGQFLCLWEVRRWCYTCMINMCNIWIDCQLLDTTLINTNLNKFYENWIFWESTEERGEVIWWTCIKSKKLYILLKNIWIYENCTSWYWSLRRFRYFISILSHIDGNSRSSHQVYMNPNIS